METKMILNPSLYVFMLDVQEQIHNGWEIDLNYPPTMFGTCYEVGMIKKDQEAIIDNFDHYVGGPDKPENAPMLTGAFASTTELHVQPLTAPVYKSYEKPSETPEKRKAGRLKTKP
jgi:hypothetical protein